MQDTSFIIVYIVSWTELASTFQIFPAEKPGETTSKSHHIPSLPRYSNVLPMSTSELNYFFSLAVIQMRKAFKLPKAVHRN